MYVKRKILVVDDTPDINYLIKLQLDKNLYDVVCVSDAVRAEDYLRNVQFNLVLCDVNLGRTKGYDLIRSRRKNGDNFTPFVFITGQSSIESEELTKNLGAVDYISKPFGRLQIPVCAARYARPTATQRPIPRDQRVLFVNNTSALEEILKDKIEHNIEGFTCDISNVRTKLESKYFDIIVFGGKLTEDHLQLIGDFQNLRPKTKFMIYSGGLNISERNQLGDSIDITDSDEFKSENKLSNKINEVINDRKQRAGEDLLKRIPAYAFGVGTRGCGKTLLFDIAAPFDLLASRDFDSRTNRKSRNLIELLQASKRFKTDEQLDNLESSSRLNLSYIFDTSRYVVPVADACLHMLTTRQDVFSVVTPYEVACKLREDMIGASQKNPVCFLPIFADPNLIIKRLMKRPGFNPAQSEQIIEQYELYRGDLNFAKKPFFNTSFRVDVEQINQNPQKQVEQEIVRNSIDERFEKAIMYKSAEEIVHKFVSLQKKYP